MRDLMLLPLLLLLLADRGHAVRRSGGHLPITSDDRRIMRPTECHMGRRVFELGAHWFADLGPPFGVMYCIRCECVAVKKKRRVVARAQCRNVKHECPEPSCPEPVLRPGRCCKVCPSDDSRSPDVLPIDPEHDPSAVKDVLSSQDDEHRKHMAAVMTARVAESLFKDDPERAPSAVPDHSPPVAATARFQLSKRSLYFSVYVSQGAPRPRAIQFRDQDGDILSELALGPGGAYQRGAGKVCGVWRRLPRDYRRLLRDGRMFAVLLWPPSLLDQQPPVGGQIVGHHSLATELFSSLLEPVPAGSDGGAAATAVVSAHSAPDTSSIHVSVLVAVAALKQGSSLVARLEDDAGHALLEEVVRATQPPGNLSEVELRSPVGASLLRQLSAGQLAMSLAVRDPDGTQRLLLRGQVVTRVSCELFQVALSPAEEVRAVTTTPASATPAAVPSTAPLPESGGELATPPAPPPVPLVRGGAWLYVQRDGRLAFWVSLDGVAGLPVVMLTLVSPRGTELEDLTPSLSESGSTAKGVLGTLGVQELRQLYSGELSLSVATEAAPAVARGRLSPRLVAAARDAERPTLLLPTAGGDPGPTALGWISVDPDCALHYDVSVWSWAGGPLSLVVETTQAALRGAPVQSRELAEAVEAGRCTEDALLDVPASELARLEQPFFARLVLRDHTTGRIVAKGSLDQAVRVPASCLSRYPDNDVVPVLHQESGTGSAGSAGDPCLWSPGAFYEDGAVWRPEPCTVCHCHRGRATCQPVTCPAAPATCRDGRPPSTPPGECCYACLNETTTSDVALQGSSNAAATGRGCRLSGHLHAPGSSWHPFLPPQGFDTCVVITCDATTLRLRYTRQKCPPLDCGNRRPIRPDPRACCQVCPAEPDTAQDEPVQRAPTPQEILRAGGCRTPQGAVQDGHRWHPRLHPFGEEKCVVCWCKAGEVSCQKKRCKRSSCASVAPDDDCCQAQCARRPRRPPPPPHG